MRWFVTCVALAVLLAGCGGSGGGSRWSDAACRKQADSIAAHAGSMLLHYRGGTVYPADMSYLGLKASLDRYDQGGCPDPPLGKTLRRSLTPAERGTLLGLLARPAKARISKALAAA